MNKAAREELKNRRGFEMARSVHIDAAPKIPGQVAVMATTVAVA